VLKLSERELWLARRYDGINGLTSDHQSSALVITTHTLTTMLEHYITTRSGTTSPFVWARGGSGSCIQALCIPVHPLYIPVASKKKSSGSFTTQRRNRRSRRSWVTVASLALTWTVVLQERSQSTSELHQTLPTFLATLIPFCYFTTIYTPSQPTNPTNSRIYIYSSIGLHLFAYNKRPLLRMGSISKFLTASAGYEAKLHVVACVRET
jgi:hypothetical protein